MTPSLPTIARTLVAALVLGGAVHPAYAFDAPSLNSPADGSTPDVESSVTFDWDSVSGATSYRLRIGTSETGVDDDTCSGCVYDDTSTSSFHSLAAGTLDASTTYYWTVRAGNATTGEGGLFATPWEISGAPPPFDAPTLRSPADGSSPDVDSTLTFDWDAVSGATTYRLRIGTSLSGIDDDTCVGCAFEDTTSSSSYNVAAGTLDSGTTYYWTVRAGSSSAGGVFATPWDIVGAAAPFVAPTLRSPADGSTPDVATALSFDWDGVSGATSYRIRVGTSASAIDDESCSSCLVDDTTGSSSYEVDPYTLSAGTRYFWTVRAGSSTAGGSFATPWDFVGGGDAPTTCGDGNVDAGERCDGTDLDDTTCADFGLTGSLRCTDGCDFDTSGCTAAECTEVNNGGQAPIDSFSFDIPEVKLGMAGTAAVSFEMGLAFDPVDPDPGECAAGLDFGGEASLCFDLGSVEECWSASLGGGGLCTSEPVCDNPPIATCDGESACCEGWVDGSLGYSKSFGVDLKEKFPAVAAIPGKLEAAVTVGVEGAVAVANQTGECACDGGETSLELELTGTVAGTAEWKLELFGYEEHLSVLVFGCVMLGVDATVCDSLDFEPLGGIQVTAGFDEVKLGWFTMDPRTFTLYSVGETCD
ncbi:MAG: hypothetical protein Q8P18_12970 [Pseudomonadota bacterium]|nr:hypothetical protein [Pseudomonadota bacterium]